MPSRFEGEGIGPAQLLAGQPPEAAPPVDAEMRIRRSLEATSTTVIVLDDDPTGTQVVHDVPVVTQWEAQDLSWLLDQPVRIGFVLTNSRSLDREAAEECNETVADRVLSLAARVGRRIEFVSRGDSTLRGHFPAEPDVLRRVIAAHGVPNDVVLLCPAFPDAGRVTVGDTHWVGSGGRYLPAAASEFAQDATFGYRSSSLPAWVEERTGGATSAHEVISLSLADVRLGGAERIAGVLASVPAGTYVVANAAADSDLQHLALGLAIAREQGRRILHRCGPSLLAPLVGMGRRAPLTPEQLRRPMSRSGAATPTAGGGLTVVGSHTEVSTAQLRRALMQHEMFHIELDVEHVLADAEQEIARVVAALAAIRTVDDAMVSTTRVRRRAETAGEDLALARAVSAALVEVVRRTVNQVPPAYLVVKGGITSSDVATGGLDVRRAMVLGQMVRGGLPVWKLDDGSLCPGLPYVIFPGNVGTDETLAEILTTLRAATPSDAPR